MSGKNKGNAFERLICTQLSLWWTKGERDDVFWRTDSGGRATRRTQQGKTTKGQYGDIVATDAIGQPLLDLVTIELKRGYNAFSISDILDASAGLKTQLYQNWIEKIIETSRQAGSRYWMLIVKRDRREAIVYIPTQFLKDLKSFVHIRDPIPKLTLNFISTKSESIEISAMLMGAFMKNAFQEALYWLFTKKDW